MKGLWKALLVVCILFPLKGRCAQNLDDLYRELHQSMRNFPQLVEKKESKLAALRFRYQHSPTRMDRVHTAFELYAAYDYYKNDSAMYYLEQCVTYSEELKRWDWMNACLIELAYRAASNGYTPEASHALSRIAKDQLRTKKEWYSYYRSYYNLYSLLSVHSNLPEYRRAYREKTRQYCDSMQIYGDDNILSFLDTKMQWAMSDKNFKEAKRLVEIWIKKVGEGTHDYAMAAYNYGVLCDSLHDFKGAQYWTLKSALTDLNGVAMNQGALFHLAQMFQEKGNLKRAYRYAHFTWECNKKFNAPQRNLDMYQWLTDMDETNRQEIQHSNHVLTVLVIAISLMVLFLSITLFYLERGKKSLANAHLDLQDVNGRLKELNLHLNEQNRIKEEYIGKFLGICRLYVDKIDQYRKNVSRKIKEGDSEELLQMMKSPDLLKKDLEELYAYFDSIFLHLFPDFVEEFNALLQPEARIKVKNSTSLPTEIRIFALIRLGVEDSSQICKFLHYSSSTIYNYRSKVKSNALGDKEDFERKVKEIGR